MENILKIKVNQKIESDKIENCMLFNKIIDIN